MAFIRELVQSGKFYFPSRPRRFGKSLLLTTLRAYFQGRKDLYAALDIYEKEKEWKKHPVIHIDYSPLGDQKSRAIFEQSLLEHFKALAADSLRLSAVFLCNWARAK